MAEKGGRRIRTHNVGMIETLEYGHLILCDLLISLDLLFRRGL